SSARRSFATWYPSPGNSDEKRATWCLEDSKHHRLHRPSVASRPATRRRNAVRKEQTSSDLWAASLRDEPSVRNTTYCTCGHPLPITRRVLGLWPWPRIRRSPNLGAE